MISPGTYTELRAQNFNHFIEQRIDEAISGHACYQANGPITIATRLFPHATRDDFERVLKKYRAGGWVAEVVDDSRDGDFIKLELP